MLQITPFTTACVKIDQYADYIPGVSTATNLVDLFLNCVARPIIGEENLLENHYFTYLETKHVARCLLLLIPVVGNIIVALSDKKRAERANGSTKCAYEAKSFGERTFHLDCAVSNGSVDSMYKLALEEEATRINDTTTVEELDKLIKYGAKLFNSGRLSQNESCELEHSLDHMQAIKYVRKNQLSPQSVEKEHNDFFRMYRHAAALGHPLANYALERLQTQSSGVQNDRHQEQKSLQDAIRV